MKNFINRSLIVVVMMQPLSALATCSPPNGSYGGTLPGLSFNSSGITDGAFLQMMTINFVYNTSLKKFTATAYGKFISNNNTSVTSTGPISVASADTTWDSTTCMGSLNINSNTIYFVSTNSGSNLYVMNPGNVTSGVGIKWMNGKLERL